MLGVVIQNVSRSSEECSRSMWTIPRIATARTCPSRCSWLCQQILQSEFISKLPAVCCFPAKVIVRKGGREVEEYDGVWPMQRMPGQLINVTWLTLA